MEPGYSVGVDGTMGSTWAWWEHEHLSSKSHSPKPSLHSDGWWLYQGTSRKRTAQFSQRLVQTLPPLFELSPPTPTRTHTHTHPHKHTHIHIHTHIFWFLLAYCGSATVNLYQFFMKLCCVASFCCSVSKLYLTLCDPMDCSTPNFPILHHLPEFAQTRAHWDDDVIQLSHPLSPPLLLPSIFPNIRIFSSELAFHIRWPKYWGFSFNISPSNKYSGLFPLGLIGLITLLSKGLSSVFSSTTVQKHQFFSLRYSAS